MFDNLQCNNVLVVWILIDHAFVWSLGVGSLAYYFVSTIHNLLHTAGFRNGLNMRRQCTYTNNDQNFSQITQNSDDFLPMYVKHILQGKRWCYGMLSLLPTTLSSVVYITLLTTDYIHVTCYCALPLSRTSLQLLIWMNIYVRTLLKPLLNKDHNSIQLMRPLY